MNVSFYSRRFNPNFNTPAHESWYVKVLVIVEVAVGFVKVAALDVVVDEKEFFLIDLGIFFTFPELRLVHGTRRPIILRDFGLQIEAFEGHDRGVSRWCRSPGGRTALNASLTEHADLKRSGSALVNNSTKDDVIARVEALGEE